MTRFFGCWSTYVRDEEPRKLATGGSIALFVHLLLGTHDLDEDVERQIAAKWLVVYEAMIINRFILLAHIVPRFS